MSGWLPFSTIPALTQMFKMYVLGQVLSGSASQRVRACSANPDARGRGRGREEDQGANGEA